MMVEWTLVVKENLLVMAYSIIVLIVGYFLVEFYPLKKAAKKHH